MPIASPAIEHIDLIRVVENRSDRLYDMRIRMAAIKLCCAVSK
jgi:ribosomal protein L19